MVEHTLNKSCCEEGDDEVDQHRRSREQHEFNEATYADGRKQTKTFNWDVGNISRNDANKSASKMIPISGTGYDFNRGVLISEASGGVDSVELQTG